MRKHILVTSECFQKIAECFSDSDEVTTFISQMDDVVDELCFSHQLRQRIHNEDEGVVLLLKQTCIFAMFCREHIDLIQQIISKVQYRELTQDEIQDLKGD